jgi:hypothetical protein
VIFNIEHVITTQDNLVAVQVNRWDQLMSDAGLLYWDTLTEDKPSVSRKELYEWQVNMGVIRRSDDGGTRRYDDLLDATYGIENEDFEASLMITRKDYEDDKIQHAAQWSDDVAGYEALLPQILLQELFAAGETELGYDGKPFFSEEHLIVPGHAELGTAANLFPGMALTGPNIALGVQNIKGTPAPGGLNAYIRPFRLLVAPDKEFDGTELLEAKFLGALTGGDRRGSTDNILTRYGFDGGIQVMQDHPADGSWYMQCRTLGRSPFKMPFVRQMRRPMEMRMYTPADSVTLGRSNNLEWQKDGRFKMAFGEHWALFKFKPGGG